ncbi:hypothetical protein SELMODRAFT_413179 [Selaginella moellendorffii]|uniref:Uncharacterized protein n=1 Tax=Selaginella moellendorffii TaxID=88036 RepID=D8RNL3_SELML|nr:hypothetical protein SELMODRAFT_413179 [Selaginella moellendorffii]
MSSCLEQGSGFRVTGSTNMTTHSRCHFISVHISKSRKTYAGLSWWQHQTVIIDSNAEETLNTPKYANRARSVFSCRTRQRHTRLLAGLSCRYKTVFLILLLCRYLRRRDEVVRKIWLYGSTTAFRKKVGGARRRRRHWSCRGIDMFDFPSWKILLSKHRKCKIHTFKNLKNSRQWKTGRCLAGYLGGRQTDDKVLRSKCRVHEVRAAFDKQSEACDLQVGETEILKEEAVAVALAAATKLVPLVWTNDKQSGFSNEAKVTDLMRGVAIESLKGLQLKIYNFMMLQTTGIEMYQGYFEQMDG